MMNRRKMMENTNEKNDTLHMYTHKVRKGYAHYVKVLWSA